MIPCGDLVQSAWLLEPRNEVISNPKPERRSDGDEDADCFQNRDHPAR